MTSATIDLNGGQGSIAEAANGDQAMTIDDLMHQIEETERLAMAESER
jgi:hypothetical protein